MKYYSEDHEWVEVRGEEATVGISAYAAENLGDITYVELPLEGDDVIVGDTLGVIEAGSKSISFYSPLSGSIVAINEDLESEPGIVSDSPEEKGWICKLTNIDNSELDDMMNETTYQKYLRSLR